MPIAEKDIKLLWGRAAGYCSNPACRTKVSEIGANGESYLTGEQAHIVARQANGPRGQDGGGSNAYENLVLLCPTCHTKIDKSPDGTYPVEVLLEWKEQHEAWVDNWAESKKMGTTAELMKFVTELLNENKHYFDAYGPRSEIAEANPGSSAHAVWTARKLDTLLPNNRKIVQALEVNAKLVPGEMKAAVLKFKDHALSYEQNQYGRLDHYQLFPSDFAELVHKWAV
ncbi:HNH endonuclease [Mesorhizobium sp. VK4C]|uniref:HNH endonuclease n=1 Tax=Mesorhizobium captivum TaxID=3072319 RepID=UPI002A246071|nr:HNH endonuclease [Mesorhizobium sp. VK4C]MDX8501606.1 HNH endonuclease [Mesorhizobium sp. VK4C]